MNNALVDALDHAIALIQAGKSQDEVLDLYPQLKEDLRPLLDAVLAARLLQAGAPAPNPAQARSRAQFLTMALSQPRKRPFFASLSHFRTALAVGATLMVVLVIGTGIASAQSVPGDILYPVKIAREQTQLLFVTDPVQRLELQEYFDTERVDEVEDLVEHSRSTEITFSGILVRVNDQLWQVARVDVIFPPKLEAQASSLANRYVEIHGILQSGGSVLAEQLQLHQIDFSGTLQDIRDGQWIISRLAVKVDDQTIIRGETSPGSTLQVKAIRLEDGSLLAIEIEGPHSEDADPQQTVSTQTPGESEEHEQAPFEDSPAVTGTPGPAQNYETENKPTDQPAREERDSSLESSPKNLGPTPTRTPSLSDQKDHEEYTRTEQPSNQTLVPTQNDEEGHATETAGHSEP